MLELFEWICEVIVCNVGKCGKMWGKMFEKL